MKNIFSEIPVGKYKEYGSYPTLDVPNTQATNFNDTKKFSGGTSTGLNTLDALRVAQGTPIDYDRDELTVQIGMLLEAHNHLCAEQLSMFCNFSPERFVRLGATDSVNMMQLDAGGIPTAQKVYVIGSNQGWPLRRFGIGLQWNNEYWAQKDMKQFANQLEAILTADKKLLASRIRRAFLKSTGETFVDFLKDQMPLPVKPLINADGTAIPPNPYGVTFDNSNHTHYMYCGSGNADSGSAAFTDTGNTAWNNSSTAASKAHNLDAMLANLREHYTDGSNIFLVSQTEAAFFAPANGNGSQIPGFQKAEYTVIKPSQNRDVLQGLGFYNPENSYDRFIGVYDGTEVWVKPWVPAGYVLLFNVSAPKPLQVRVNDTTGLPGTTVNGSNSMGGGDLRMVFEYQPYPLYAQAMVRDFDVAASTERQNGVAMFVNSASAYTNAAYW